MSKINSFKLFQILVTWPILIALKTFKMSLKWLFFFKKIARIAQLLGAYGGNLFSRTQPSQPTTFNIVITGVLNKQNVVRKCNYYSQTLFDYTIMHFHG